MSQNLKSALQYLVIFGIGGVFLYFVFRDTDWADLWQRMAHANLFWLSAGMVVALVSHWIRAYRATLLYAPLGFQVSTLNSYYAVLIGYMMNYVIPRAGEVSRCASLVKTDNVPIEKSLGTVVTERIVDLVILALIMAFIFVLRFDLILDFVEANSQNSGSANTGNGSFLKFILVAVVILVATVLWFTRKKLAEHPLWKKVVALLKGFSEGLMSVRNVKNPGLFVLLSVLIWVGYILMMYFCLFALPSTSGLSFADCLTVFAIGTIGVVLPAPGAGAGTYHYFVMQSLLLFGVQKEEGIAYATLVHGAQMIILIALGLVSSLLVMLNQRKKVKHE